MYALIDCNNFYVSCERAFKPHLHNKPIIVLSNNDGCVISRSNEAKALEIPMAAPLFKCREIIKDNNVLVFSSNYELYDDMSRRIISILSEFTPRIEVYSIDESFIDLTGFAITNLKDYALNIVKSVKQRAHIPVSVGIAPSKSLAKIANKIAKNFETKTNSVCVLDTEEKCIKALKHTKIEDVWGIGYHISKRLQNIGIYRAYDFTQLPDDYVRSEFTVVGLRLKKDLEGQSIIEFNKQQKPKNIAITRTFPKVKTTYEDMKERVATFTVSCAEKLRRKQLACKQLEVFIKTNKHAKDHRKYYKSILVKLPQASNSNFTLIEYAIKGLEMIFKSGYGYKRAGVILSDFVDENTVQTNLFYQENIKYKPLMNVMDNLNEKYGKNTVIHGVQSNKKWHNEQSFVSNRYTTCWDELLEVN